MTPNSERTTKTTKRAAQRLARERWERLAATYGDHQQEAAVRAAAAAPGAPLKRLVAIRRLAGCQVTEGRQ